MKIVAFVKRDMKSTCPLCVLISAATTLFTGVLSFSCVGYPRIYKKLILPGFAPSPFVFAVVWSLVFIALGALSGAILGSRCLASVPYKRAGLFFYYAAMLVVYLWYPVFFGAKAFFLALLLIPLMMILFFVSAKYFFRVNMPFALFLVLLQGWLAYLLLLNLCAVILN